MKILVAYHSYSKNTEKLAKAIRDEFIKSGHTVDLEKVEPAENRSSGSWFMRRLFVGECAIKPPRITDVSSYDLICFGSPNWTRISLPMSRYIATVKGLQYKNVGFFATTALPPLIEWFVFSAYLLDLSCSMQIERLKGRLLDTLLISSVFKAYSVDSPWGKEKIANYCKTLTTPIQSYKNYFLEQKERESVRFQIVVLISLLILSPFIYLFFTIFTPVHYTLIQYATLLSMGITTLLTLLGLMETKKSVHLGKYIFALFFVLCWTSMIFFVDPLLEKEILVGYILIIASMSFFREPLAVWVTGAECFLGYFFLIFIDSYPKVSSFPEPSLNVLFILTSTLITMLIAQNIKHNYLILLDFQGDLDSARMNLESKLNELQNAWNAVKKEHQKTDAIIANLTDALLIFDTKGELILTNPAAQKVLDCKDACGLEKITGKNIKELKNIAGFDRLVEVLNNPNEKKEIVLENKHILEVVISKTEDIISSVDEKGEKRYMQLVLLHDVTESRKLEEMKVNFASIAAHELRTPITVIEGYLSFLTDGKLKLSDTDKISYLNKACIASRKLSSLIESLLVVTRVEQGREVLHQESIEVSDLIDEVVQDLTPEIQAKGQSIEISLPVSPIPSITVDKLKTKEILSNLLTNANRYTQQGGHIKITAGTKDNFLEISVEDDGQGIPSEIQPFLFTKFTRAENAIRKETKGVGLGLYLIKSLAELQGGKVWFTSTPNKGSTFSFSLPYKNASGIKV